MIQLVLVLKVRSINGKLVISLEFTLVAIRGSPWILALTNHDKHTMVYCGAVVFAPHLNLGRRRVVIGIGSEDDPPSTANLVDLGGPEISRVGLVRLWVEDGLGLCIVPVCH